MLLLIDNYDSFTYNLAQYFGELGCELVVRRNDAISLEEIDALAPECICISPGPVYTARGGNQQRRDSGVWPTHANSGCLLGTSMHRRSLWRRNRSCFATDARKGIDNYA